MKHRNPSLPLSRNKHLLRCVEKMAELTKPAAIHWVDGSKTENDALCAQMVASGTFIKLNEDLWPGCYYARSDPSDVARVEDRTFICSLSKDSAGPTNNWLHPYEMRRKVFALSRFPNVYIKVHGLGEFCQRAMPVTEPFPFERSGALDLDAYLAERQPGGLGVYIIKRFMDEVEYRHRPEVGNELRMRKYLIVGGSRIR